LKALDESKNLFHLLQTKLQYFFTQLYEGAKELASTLEVDVRMPRVLGAGKQPQRANAPSESVEEHFKINLHNPFLDHLITEIQTRLLNASDRIEAEHLLPQNVSSMTDSQWSKIQAAYGQFISLHDLSLELERWQFKFKDIGNKTKYLLQDCLHMTKDLYPNLNIIFTILFTMPVSVASAERSFSALKRLKTYLR